MFVIVRHVHPILTMARKARSLPLEGYVRVGSSLAYKYWTRESDKPTNLLRYRINYNRKSFIVLAQGSTRKEPQKTSTGSSTLS